MRPIFNTMSLLAPVSPCKPIKVLIIGGSYAGLSTAMNLLRLSQSHNCKPSPKHDGSSMPQDYEDISLHVHIIDERDGFCKLLYQQYKLSANTSFPI
jgi:hypothetical protein